jgi:hypothetical protein
MAKPSYITTNICIRQAEEKECYCEYFKNCLFVCQAEVTPFVF